MKEIIYIAGFPRCGSTLLGNSLAELPGVQAVGEVVFLFNKHVSEGVCACGLPFEHCTLWRQTYNEFNIQDARPAHASHPPYVRNLHLAITGKDPAGSDTQTDWGKIYSKIFESSGASYIVDESKFARHLVQVKNIPNLKLRVIHLVRHPLAVAYSWTRWRSKAHSENFMERYPPYITALRWILENLAIEKITHGLPTYFLRYEDFVSNPNYWFGEIQKWAGLPEHPIFDSQGNLEIKKIHHLIASNPVGSQRGHLSVRMDNEWQQHASEPAYRFIHGITAPLLKRYGYSE